jgi:RNA polymerase sigma-70 factor, ECF subfamily
MEGQGGPNDGTGMSPHRPKRTDDVTATATARPATLDTPRREGSRLDEADLRLVEACARGDHKAMEALYHRFKRRVYSLAIRIAGAADADEVAQEAFVRIFRGLAKFRGDSALETWIYRLAVNAALSHIERRPARAEGEEALAHIAAATPPARDPRLAARLEAALGDLPAGYRAVLVLHDVEGLSHEEIGDILGCRVGTSKSQLHKARVRMREILAPHLGDAG